MRKKIIALSIILPLSAQVSASALNLNPPFGDAKTIEFTYSVFPSGDRSISATLVADAPANTTQIANICEPEGGDATIGNVATVARNSVHGDILATTCIYKLNHSGIGLAGTQFQTKIFEKENNTLKELISEEELLSGFEGQTEDGDELFYFYKNPVFFTEKLKLIMGGNKSDSINLAHAIAIETLKKDSAEAAGKYLSEELTTSLSKNHPITKKNAPLYNDIGYALVEAKKMEQALSILLPIEKIAPQRIPLYLNIADAYWPTRREEAKNYYEKYQTLMIKKNKRNLIPERVKERIKNSKQACLNGTSRYASPAYWKCNIFCQQQMPTYAWVQPIWRADSRRRGHTLTPQRRTL